MEQGLATNTVLKRTPHGNPSATEMASKSAATAAEMRGAQGAGALGKEQAGIERLHGVKSVAMAPAQLEIAGMLGGGVLTWITKKFKWERATAAIRGLLTAPVEAMRNTSLAEIFHLPVKYLNSFAGHAKEAGGKATVWADAAEKKAATMAESAARMDARTAEAFAPVGKKLGAGLDYLEQETAAGKAVHGMFDRWTGGKAVSSATKHAQHMEKATAAVTQEGVGFFRKIMNFITRKTPQTVEAGALAPIMSRISAAHGNADMLKEVATDLEKMIKTDGLKGEIAKRADNVAGYLGKAVRSAQATHAFEGATGGTLKSMVAAVGKAVGRVPVFSALIGTGVVAGLGAMALTARSESKLAKQAMQDLTADMGGNTQNAFMAAVQQAQTKQKWFGKAKVGLQTVGEVAEGAMWVLPGGGGMAMMGAMLLPGMLQGLVPDNVVLNAYTALKQADAGKIQLQPDQRVYFMKQLIAVMPSVASHGGMYNHLVTPVAEAMHNQHMTATQVVQLLGDETKFTGFAKDVAEKQAAAKVEKPVEAANDAHIAAPAAAKETAEARYHAAEKPGLAQVSAVRHAGTVAANHDQMRAQA